MKTSKEVNQLLKELSNDQIDSSVGLCKAIALMEFNGEAYEIQKDEDGDFQVFTVVDGERGDLVDPIEGDEERDNYIVLTDEEADEKAKESILDSLWAFTPDFLSERTELDAEVFQAIQENGKCESNNDTILRLVEKLDNVDDFVNAAISADGRGHFLNTYDGQENEETVGNTTFYIYRMN